MPTGMKEWTQTRRKGVRLKDLEGKYGTDPFSRPLPDTVRAIEVFDGKAGWFGGRQSKTHRHPGALLMAANGVPEAVIKFASWGSGKQSGIAQFDYVSRDGELEIELDDGSILQGKEDIRDLLEDWSDDFHQRKGGTARNTVHFIVSAPMGSDRDAVQDAARDWAAKVFEGNHPYGLVRHDDADHPHVHVIAKVRGHDRSRFSFGRDDLQRFREIFAERCTAHGVEMTATPREWRGAARGESLALRKMRESGRTPIIDTLAERFVTVDKDRPANNNREKARDTRAAALRAEAADHRKLADAFEMAGAAAGGGGSAYMGQATRLNDLADYLDRGGETSRPDRLRGMVENRRPKTMSDKPAKDFERVSELAYKEVREAEDIANRMVAKLPEGADRQAAVLAAANITRAREVLDPERENTPLERAPERESVVGPDKEAEAKAPKPQGHTAQKPTTGPSRTIERERMEKLRDRDVERDRD